MQTRPKADAPSARTRVRRHPERGHYERELIDAILDEGLLAHLGIVDEGRPLVVPTMYARDGDRIYLHGSRAARWVKLLASGAEACLSVTLIDGLVLARSAFKHSMNYRSVVIFGTATALEDRAEQLRAVAVLVDHVVPGRSRQAPLPNEHELGATALFSLSIAESSAKVRSGGPLDFEDDFERAVWAGVLPARVAFGAPLPDPLVSPTVPPAAELLAYARARSQVRR